MKFELSGTNASQVMTGFKKALASGDVSSLAELEDIFDEIESGAMSAAEASEIFGTRAGPEIVSAVRSGTMELDSFVDALENSGGTLEATAETAQTLDQKWEQAGNNIKIAFTKAIEPAVSGVSSAFAEAANNVGTFLNAHPVLTKALTAVGIGLGAVAAGIAGVTLVATAAKHAVTAFGAAVNSALGPVGWIALAITGVVTVGASLIAMFSDAENETDNMTAATKEQYYQLQDLTAEYETACTQYGENSKEALRLKYQVDDLSNSFEASRKTIEEFSAEVDELCESAAKVTDDFYGNMSAIKDTETSSLALIQRYEDLSTQVNRTGAQEKELEAITQSLTESYPDLASRLDATKMSAEDYADAMRRACEQQAEAQRQQQANQTYIEALNKKLELEEKLSEAEANLAQYEFVNGFGGIGYVDTKASRAAFEDVEKLKAERDENQATLDEITRGWEKISEAEQETAAEAVTAYEAVSTATESTSERIAELAQSYHDVYQSAYDSIHGQYDLFDEATIWTEDYMTATVQNAQEALDSQLAYWEDYNANLTALTEYGNTLTGQAKENFKALLAYAQDGSEQAAGLASSMAAAIENGDQNTIATLSETMAKVTEQQDQAAKTTADFVTDFSNQIDEIEADMKNTVEDMTLEDEAAEAAKSTIEAYIEQIKAGAANAEDAAEFVSSAVAAALNKIPSVPTPAAPAPTTASNIRSIPMPTTPDSIISVPGHARGTTNAENLFLAGENGPELVARSAAAYANGTTNSTNYFIAGENGPELIAGEQGSTVFPTNETDRLISALDDKRAPLQIGAENDKPNNGIQEQTKHIRIEIAGSGAIEVGETGANKETILNILTEHLKPTLMKIIQGEIFEEGALSYEY